MLKILVHGYKGRLGNAICRLAETDNNCEIIAGVDVSANKSGDSFPVFQDIFDCDMPADVIVDCSVASAVPKVLEFAVSNKTPIVICTTGLNAGVIEQINTAAKSIPVFRSANMSLGINLISSLMEKMVKALGDSNFDIEIIEKHHNQKIDAPSGTALLLADKINAVSNNAYEYVYDRSKVTKKRDKKELGISAVRGGTIVGEHSVIFAGNDEVIEIKHMAASKEVFAAGALKAAKYIAVKTPALYDMQSLMGEM